MKNISMVEYKDNIFTKIKNKIKALFSKNELRMKKETDEEKQDRIRKEKERIMALYNRIKENEEIIPTVDDEDLYKIMLLLNEEILLVSGQMESKAKVLEEKVEEIESKKETA